MISTLRNKYDSFLMYSPSILKPHLWSTEKTLSAWNLSLVCICKDCYLKKRVYYIKNITCSQDTLKHFYIKTEYTIEATLKGAPGTRW